MTAAAAASRRVFITGAGSGLGRALSLKFASEGFRVAVTDIKPADAEATLELIRSAGGAGFAMACNVASQESFAAVADRLKREWQGVDVLINNAGVATGGTVVDSPIAQWNFAWDINVLGCVRGCQAIVPMLVAQGSGHVVNVASFAGFTNAPALASYSATKAAVISLSETLRFELHAQNVGVSVVCPAFFKTNLMQTSAEQSGGISNAAPQMERIVQRLMEKASVTAEDVAADVFDAVREKRFMVMTHADARRTVLIKRISPELYFKRALGMTQKFLKRPE
jgi:NAD(P)-dependent dehydrogenase (short-subunit alcohol dehydrogenase family)